MEALQMLKFALHQNAMDFTSNLLMHEEDIFLHLTRPYVSVTEYENVMDRIVQSIA